MDFLQMIGGKKRKVINSQSPEVFTYFFQTWQIFSMFCGDSFWVFFFSSLNLFLADRQHNSVSLDTVIYSFSPWGSHLIARGQLLALPALLQQKSSRRQQGQLQIKTPKE